MQKQQQKQALELYKNKGKTGNMKKERWLFYLMLFKYFAILAL